jgi:hypothetical protein
MRLPNSAQTSRPWRIHELTHDFRLEDVWALPTPGGPRDFHWIVERFASSDPSRGSLPGRALCGLGVSPEILRYLAERQKSRAELLTVVPEPGEIPLTIFVIPEDSRTLVSPHHDVVRKLQPRRPGHRKILQNFRKPDAPIRRIALRMDRTVTPRGEWRSDRPGSRGVREPSKREARRRSAPPKSWQRRRDPKG